MVTVKIIKNKIIIDPDFEPTIGNSRQITYFKQFENEFKQLLTVKRDPDVIVKIVNYINIPEFELSHISVNKDSIEIYYEPITK